MAHFDLSRRRFLRAVGAGAAAAPFVNILAESLAQAQMMPRPKRFVGLYYPHGAASPLYTMRAGETETSFELNYPGSVLQAFDDPQTYGRSFKDKLLVLEGVDLSSAIQAGATGHSAPSSLLTGWGGTPGGPSLDQYLAVDRGLGMSTPITSLVLGVGSASPSNDDCISFAGNGAPLSKIIEPPRTFELAFRSVIAGQDPAAAQALASEQRQRRSVLDFMKADLGRLSARLAGPERAKLDQHLTSIRELEKAVDALTQSAGGACTLPARPGDLPRYGAYNGGEPYFEEITNLQIDLLAQAMACDLTRFGTLWLADLSRGAAMGTGLDVPDDCHNDLAHTYAAPRGPHYGGGDPGVPATWEALGVQNRYSYGKAARLLQRFNEHGILDDVVVFMTTDMGDPAAHSSRNVPMLLLGGGGGWTMGRRLKMNDDCPPDRWYCEAPSLVPHNQVLVSIARAFGVAADNFGNPEIAGGGLPGLG